MGYRKEEDESLIWVLNKWVNSGSAYGKEELEGKAGFMLGMLNLRTFSDEQVGNHVGRWISRLNSAAEKPQLEA